MAMKHVAVLMGGFSSERPVSLSSGNACADALEAEGYRVTRVDVGRDVASGPPSGVARAGGIPVAGRRGRRRCAVGEGQARAPPSVGKTRTEGPGFGVVPGREEASPPPQIVASAEWAYGDMVMVERYVH